MENSLSYEKVLQAAHSLKKLKNIRVKKSRLKKNHDCIGFHGDLQQKKDNYVKEKSAISLSRKFIRGSKKYKNSDLNHSLKGSFASMDLKEIEIELPKLDFIDEILQKWRSSPVAKIHFFYVNEVICDQNILASWNSSDHNLILKRKKNLGKKKSEKLIRDLKIEHGSYESQSSVFP